MGGLISIEQSFGQPLALTQYDIEDVQEHCNHKFTSAEIQSLFQRFRALDRRHKGYISGEELMNVPELAMNPLAQRVVQMFENCNFKDFVRLLSAFSQRSSRAEQLRWLFELYDVDGDGAVSRADLLTLMRNRAGSQLTDEQLGELVDRALQGVPPGASGERQLSFEAFCQEFAGYSAPAGATLLKVKVPTDC